MAHDDNVSFDKLETYYCDTAYNHEDTSHNHKDCTLLS